VPPSSQSVGPVQAGRASRTGPGQGGSRPRPQDKAERSSGGARRYVEGGRGRGSAAGRDRGLDWHGIPRVTGRPRTSPRRSISAPRAGAGRASRLTRTARPCTVLHGDGTADDQAGRPAGQAEDDRRGRLPARNWVDREGKAEAGRACARITTCSVTTRQVAVTFTYGEAEHGILCRWTWPVYRSPRAGVVGPARTAVDGNHGGIAGRGGAGEFDRSETISLADARRRIEGRRKDGKDDPAGELLQSTMAFSVVRSRCRRPGAKGAEPVRCSQPPTARAR